MQNLERVSQLNKMFSLENTGSNFQRLDNQLNAENLGYQNSSNETIYKGSNFIKDNLKSVDEIFEENGLNFEVVKRDLFFKNELGEMIPIKNYQAFCHDTKDTCLNIPKLQYVPLQLSSIKYFINSIRDKVLIESIMNIEDKRFIINLSINDAIQDVKKDDPHKLRLVIVSSHDSSTSCHISFFHTRMFCFNQMNSLKQSNPLVFKHTKSIRNNIERINSIIDWNRLQFTKSVNEYKELIKKEVKQEDIKNVLENLFYSKWHNQKVCLNRQTKESRDKVYTDLIEVKKIKERLEREFEQNGRNAYSLHNGINYYFNHEAAAQNIQDESEKARIRAEAIYFGKSISYINKSKELCLSL